MIDKPNVFNIPANYHFFESLLFWAEKEFGDKLNEVKFFLPNRRSCREFHEVFSKSKHLLLPNLKAISDISYEDFFDFLPNVEAKLIIDEILQTKSLSDIDYLFFLSEEIQKYSAFGENIDFGQAFKIAVNLKNLFDEIEREEIDPNKFLEIDDSNLSQHRIITLDFLKKFHVEIKNRLLKERVFCDSMSNNFIVKKFTHLLENYDSKSSIVIAGSTGSVEFSSKLIKAASKKHRVILHGANDENYEEENHPQFFLNRLINNLQISKNEIQQIKEEKFILSPQVRQQALSLTTLPVAEVTKWQEISKYVDFEFAKKDLAQNFLLIEARNEIEEAKLIRLALIKAVKSNKTAAVITNNGKLADLVKLELQNNLMLFNDSRSRNISDSKLVGFLLLILELIETNFNSHALLTLLKHPLSFYAKNHEMLVDFEINILRQDRAELGLKGIFKKLENHPSLLIFFNEFCDSFELFLKINKPKSLSEITTLLILACENLSKKNWQELLLEEEAQTEIFEAFEKLKQQDKTLINSGQILDSFKTILSQIKFFEKSSAFAPIQILSTLEARLLNYDLVVVSSLNQGSFPEVEGENWLGKKIKKDLGIDKSLKKSGQSANDFCNYLSNKSIILTRSKSRNGAALIDSPLLLKFKVICKKLGAEINDGKEFFTILERQNCVTKKVKKIPNPKPKLEFRPQKISITEVMKLMTNPYEIYAKKILKLEELKKIDFEPSHAEFGSFIHKALEEYVKNSADENFYKKARNIFDEYFLLNESEIIWWPKFENIFEAFVTENKNFSGLKNMVEIPAELKIGNVKLRGKIDRVIINEKEELLILDYKTGQIPAKSDVASGLNPQLTIAALMLEDRPISYLGYWKLSSSSGSEIKKISDDQEEIYDLIFATQVGLKNLFKFFADEKNGYLATENNIYNPYQNLARIT